MSQIQENFELLGNGNEIDIDNFENLANLCGNVPSHFETLIFIKRANSVIIRI